MASSSHPNEPTLPPILTATFGHRSSPALVPALIGAGLIHLVAILMAPFEPPKPVATPEMAIEVLILRETAQGTSQPFPDASLSQQNLAGESPRGDAAMSSLSNITRPPNEETAVSQAVEETRQVIAPEQPPSDQVAQNTIDQEPPTPPIKSLSWSDPAVLAARLTPTPDSQPLPDPLSQRQNPADTARILASQGPEIARLTASLEARASNYASRVRRKSISASTREYRYASYLGAWARKVERIGNLNYPQAAKEQQLYGSLILHVALRADGSVDSIRVVRSSGIDLLDQAAIQIVELAAPYSPFPPDIAAETDVLDIIRTWQFTQGGVLGWER